MKQIVKKVMICLFAGFLCACSSSSGKIDRNLVGVYELQRIEGGSVDDGISEEEVKELKEFKLVCYLYMNEDGTAVLDNYGTEERFIWDNKGFHYVDSDEVVTYEAGEDRIIIKDEETSQARIPNEELKNVFRRLIQRPTNVKLSELVDQSNKLFMDTHSGNETAVANAIELIRQTNIK